MLLMIIMLFLLGFFGNEILGTLLNLKTEWAKANAKNQTK